VNGPPANPISGVPFSSDSSDLTASVMYGTSPGSSERSWARSASARIGRSTTGPTPGAMSMPTPIALSGTTMSLNRIAASTAYRRTGCRVISVIRSGVAQAVSIEVLARALRYSGSDRPAWRMYQTGVYGTGSRRQARRKTDSSGCDVTSQMMSYGFVPARQARPNRPVTRRGRSTASRGRRASINLGLARRSR
jgi:hypothetical protein